jgi:hypothetical protein
VRGRRCGLRERVFSVEAINWYQELG